MRLSGRTAVVAVAAVASVSCQLGQMVTLPLWVDSGNSSGQGSFDSYFVYNWACLLLLVVFTFLSVIGLLTGAIDISDLRANPMPMFVTGVFDGINGLLVVFAASGSRTPVYLQSILPAFNIPVTVSIRLLLLKKKPSVLKLACSLSVVFGLLICIVPPFFLESSDRKAVNSTTDHNLVLGTTAAGVPEEANADKFAWSVIFMLGFLPAVLMNVLMEKYLDLEQDEQSVSIVWFLTMQTLSQWIVSLMFSWADLIPWFGMATDIRQFKQSYTFGATCFFHVSSSMCTWEPFIMAMLFVGFYVGTYASSCVCLRYGEGATFLAIVNAFVTPGGFLFWTLFQEEPKLHLDVEFNVNSYFAIAGLCIIFPATLAYNKATVDANLDTESTDLLDNNFGAEDA